MHIAYIADAGSPIAEAWFRRSAALGHTVDVVSSYPRSRPFSCTGEYVELPLAFSDFRRGGASERRTTLLGKARNWTGEAGLGTLGLLRDWVGPRAVAAKAAMLRDWLLRRRPDVVHALRIPFEGVVAALAVENVDVPLIVSVWGNDFTLHAAHSLPLALATRRTLARANWLHPDCVRDLQLARMLGFSMNKPYLIAPGTGGLDCGIFRQGSSETRTRKLVNVEERIHLVVNPRGIRSYVRNESFFEAVRLVAKRRRDVAFVGVGMAGKKTAERWARCYEIKDQVRLLPAITREEISDLFRAATISVSPAIHDGTPNTLLESMACGAFPISGNIASVREWVTHGRNGYLVDPSDSEALASAILSALDNPELRKAAASVNNQIIRQRACESATMPSIETMYARICEKRASYGLRAGASD